MLDSKDGGMTSDQRVFYVRGVMEALAKVKVTAEVATAICDELGIMPEDLMNIIQEERKDATAK